jgi:hypothetical protein
MDSLDTLVALITSGVSDIKAAYAAESVDFPTLDNPYVPASVDGKVLDAVNVVVTAAFHLIAMIRTPMDSVLDATFGVSFIQCRSLQTCYILFIRCIKLPRSEQLPHKTSLRYYERLARW